MTELRGRVLKSYRNGEYRLMVLEEGGSTSSLTKAGEVDVPFYAGDVVVCREDGVVIFGPVGPSGSIALATAILNGDRSILTDSRSLLTLAAAVVAFQIGGLQ